MRGGKLLRLSRSKEEYRNYIRLGVLSTIGYASELEIGVAPCVIVHNLKTKLIVFPVPTPWVSSYPFFAKLSLPSPLSG
jgi:hypothetical protein